MLIIFLFFNFVLFLLFNNFYKVIGIYDSPNSILKTHHKKMPVYGGIIFFLNFILFFFLILFYFFKMIIKKLYSIKNTKIINQRFKFNNWSKVKGNTTSKLQTTIPNFFP